MLLRAKSTYVDNLEDFLNKFNTFKLYSEWDKRASKLDTVHEPLTIDEFMERYGDDKSYHGAIIERLLDEMKGEYLIKYDYDSHGKLRGFKIYEIFK